jgi:hypothetical protein
MTDIEAVLDTSKGPAAETPVKSPDPVSPVKTPDHVSPVKTPDPVSPEKTPEIKEIKDDQKKWYSGILSFFGSYVGLLILLALYTIAGAYYFYNLESQVESKNYDSMVEAHQKLKDSADYLADFYADIHYSPIHTYNDCDKMVDDFCYQDVRAEGYFSACADTKMCENSQFCSCITRFRMQFEKDVSSLKLIHVVFN